MLILAGAAAPAAPNSAATPDTNSGTEHTRAITLAREGALEEALQILAGLRATYPDDDRLRNDELVVLSWAERDADVIARVAGIDLGTTPDYVLSAIAKAGRNTGDMDLAISSYNLLLERDPENIDARLGIAMSLADAGYFEDAQRIIETTPESDANASQLMLAEAYLLERQRHPMHALSYYQKVLEADPGNRTAVRGQILVLRKLLLPREALLLAEKYPGTIGAEETIQLQADVAALQLRYGAQSSYPNSRRFEGIDRGLAKIDSLLARDDLDPAVRERLQLDRIVALTDRLRMTDAISTFEAIPAEPAALPVYVLAAIGRAYLHEREPELAQQHLEIALAREPENVEIRYRLFFAYAETQDHARALELTETLLNSLPPVNRLPGSSVAKGSEAYLRAAILVGLAQAYADQLSESQQYFETLLSDIPHNTDVRQELANVYRWRGWLDRSLYQYAQVLAVEPELVSARIGRAYTQLDYRDYAAVDRELTHLTHEYSFEPAVQSLQREWLDHSRQQVRIDTVVGRSSGSTFGQDQYQVDATWYSSPMAYRYRATIRTHDAYAEFPEGSSRRKRIGAGVEYRHKRWFADAGISADRSGGDVGFRTAVDYRINDFFGVGGHFDLHSNATPLRGENVGISSDVVGLNARYARNESTAVQLALTFQDYSDGNSGRSVYIGAQQRLLNHHSYKMTALGEIFSAHNSQDNVPYYSPRRSFNWSAGLANDWHMYRRYDFGLSHAVTGRIGQHDQAGYGTDGTWSIEYRLVADFNTRWDAYIGIKRQGNVYDGARETANFALAGLGGRF